MSSTSESPHARTREATRRRRRRSTPLAPQRHSDYRQLRNTLPRAGVLTGDQIEAIQESALKVLRELGIRILLPEARECLRAAGATVDEATALVKLEPELVLKALDLAPRNIEVTAADASRTLHLGGDHLYFGAGAGCPNVTDLDRGRHPGTLETFREFIKLQQHFDIIHKLGPSVEPQDIPIHLRHYAMMRSQMQLSDKVPFIYSRGRRQVLDSFEMLRLARGLSEEQFRATPRTMTVINSNSPRQLDIPMSRGIMDFAEWGQVSVITPFCLAGAMAPITIAGALALSHAEALVGITLAQSVRPGAPVVYGAFSSNVDMRSGAPVFGTPEHARTNFAAGQLARHIGLPWRSGAGSAANAPDIQGASETQFAVWSCVLAGAHLVFHSAGWLEGGLTVSCEKFITDVEVLQMLAETLVPVPCESEDIAFEAIGAVEPGGHFFGAEHTMSRYSTQFYEPLVWDWSNYGQWREAGAASTAQVANGVWKKALEDFEPPPLDSANLEAMEDFIARRIEAGGAPIDG